MAGSKNKPRQAKISLSEEDRMLVTLRDELYGGSWERMLKDLNGRLNGKPYIFKLATRIEEDIRTVGRLAKLEERRGVNLSDFLPDEES